VITTTAGIIYTLNIFRMV